METNSATFAVVPIALAFTKEYIIPAATCIFSILKNSGSKDQFHFICLLSKPLEQVSRDHLQQIVGSKGEISFIEIENQLSNVYIVQKYTIAASYRLLLPDLLPQYDKVLYMDCDMIIQNDVAKLFREMDLGDHYMAGVMEATLPEQEDHLSAIECLPGKYMNSGFLLMNLNALRADNMVNKFLQASENDTLEFPDQDVINMLCKGRLLALPPIWNSIRTFFLPQYKNQFLKYYTESDWNHVQDQGNIHYTGPKPWNGFSVKFDWWWRYYMAIPLHIRREYPINNKVYYFFKIYNSTIGGLIVNSTQNIYRKIKKNNDG